MKGKKTCYKQSELKIELKGGHWCVTTLSTATKDEYAKTNKKEGEIRNRINSTSGHRLSIIL